jgi:hypothetical protein
LFVACLTGLSLRRSSGVPEEKYAEPMELVREFFWTLIDEPRAAVRQNYCSS